MRKEANIMRINNNIMALNSHRQYTVNNGAISKNVEKLSSGYRINRAGDDAAGLAISEKMRAQIRGLNMASKNSQDAISLVQTAEGALQSSHDILQRMRELAVQAASDTNQISVDREALNSEFQQLIQEINDTATKTTFNNMGIIDGFFGGKDVETPSGATIKGTTFVVQSGANMLDEMKINIKAMFWTQLTEAAKSKVTMPPTPTLTEKAPNEDEVNLRDRVNASTAITIVNAAINVVSSQRSELGALQNRLEFKIQNLNISAENLQAAESRIRDADMAKMMTDFTKNSILFQASTAMLAQANALPQGVLQLL
jgi:flagellin